MNKKYFWNQVNCIHLTENFDSFIEDKKPVKKFKDKDSIHEIGQHKKIRRNSIKRVKKLSCF